MTPAPLDLDGIRQRLQELLSEWTDERNAAENDHRMELDSHIRSLAAMKYRTLGRCIAALRKVEAQVGSLTAQGPRAQTDRVQWTLDNIYTIARRELNRAPDRLRPEMWAHVARLCEEIGCQPKGVLKDNGGSLPDPPALPVLPQEKDAKHGEA